MDIRKITLSGYRNIVNSTIEFDKITSIVALNNFGKSNFLNGIDFALDFIKNSDKTKLRMMRHIGSLPINNKTANDDFYFSIEGIWNSDNIDYTFNYEFVFSWIKENKKGSKIKQENLRIKENVSNARYSSLIIREDGKSLYKASPTGRCNSIFEVSQNELLVNKLLSNNSLFYFQLLKEINNIKIDIITFMDINKAFDSIKINENTDELDLNDLDTDYGHNLPQIVYHLKENYPSKYEMLINTFTSLIPSIESIQPVCVDFKSKISLENQNSIPFEIPEKLYEIRVKEKHNNQETEIAYLSSGSKRIFSLLTSAIIADETNTSLIAFEELENSIHPYLFQKLIIVLTNIVENCKILITSHSPYVIKYLDLDSIHFGVPSNDGAACFKKIKKTMQKSIIKYSTELDISTGDYLFDLLVDSYINESTHINNFME